MTTPTYNNKPVYECGIASDGTCGILRRNARAADSPLRSQPSDLGLDADITFQSSSDKPIASPFDPRLYALAEKLPEPTNEELLGTIR